MSKSGLSSLLKYRYQSKKEKISNNNNDGSSQGSLLSNSDSKASKGSVSSPTTPSPVVSKKRNVARLISESDDENETVTEQNGSANSTPRGPSHNIPATATHREKVAGLKLVFPQEPKWHIENILAMVKGDVDKAINEIMKESKWERMNSTQSRWHLHPNSTNNSQQPSVGSSQSSTTSNQPSTPSSPEVKPPPRKRIRRMDSESSDEGGSSTPIIVKPSTSKTTPQRSQIRDLDELKRQVDTLEEAFPHIVRHVLYQKLKENDYSVERAKDVLTRMEAKGTAALKTLAEGTNVGSIKAFQEARKAASITMAQEPVRSPVKSPVRSPIREPPQVKEKPKVYVGKVRKKLVDHDVIELDDDMDDNEYSGEDSEDEEDEDPAETDPIVTFLNEAEEDELISMPNCSKKKTDILLTIRPFKDWEDLAVKLEQHKLIPLITSARDLLQIRKVVDRLMKHCEGIANQMGTIVAELMSTASLGEEAGDQGYITSQPKCMNPSLVMKPYQLVGLNWLMLMHDQNLNGILADEMGLGKTVQTISFLSQLLEEGDKGPHVIVAPSSTLDNWLRELQRWSPDLKVVLYYGSQDERREIRAQILEGRIGEFNVLVTTYNMATGGAEDRMLFKQFKFHYAVFDEGHMLKNMHSLRYKNLMKIRSCRRLLLTGTPLQNNLVELMSLLCFVMPEMFHEKTEQLKTMFNSIATRGSNEARGVYEKETISRAKSIMKPFVLRRLKNDVLSQLPKKKEYIEKVPMVFEQQELYDELREQFSKRIEERKELLEDIKQEKKKGKKAGKTEKTERRTEQESQAGQGGSSMLMDLRKAANHQLLHRRLFTDDILKQMAKLMLREHTHRDANQQFIYEDMQVMNDFELHRLCENYKSIKKFKLDEGQLVDSGKFRYLDGLLPDLKDMKSRVLLFSQFTMMLDIVEVYMKARGYKYLRLDGQTPVAERQELIDRFNNENEIFVFLVSTKAGGLGINLTAANVVIIHDIDFNPYNDKQAEDRCHRLGQCKDVTVYRLVSKNTIEEAMLRCAQAKLRLERDVTGMDDTEDKEETDMASLLKEALGIAAPKE